MRAVPLEPTQEMIDAGIATFGGIVGTPENLANPEYVERTKDRQRKAVIDHYKAMIAAAPAPVDGLVDFNINEDVKVKLTKRGMDLHRKNHDDLNRMIADRGGDAGEYRPPKLDADGFYETQMWCLMREFGKHICMGMDSPFETTIKLEVAALQSRDEPVADTWIIWFDDADRKPELFCGHGATQAANKRYEQISVSWNAHLFAKVHSNNRDATPPRKP